MKCLSHISRGLFLVILTLFSINALSQTTIYSESFTSGTGSWAVASTGSGTGAWVQGSNSSHSTGATGNYFYSQKYSSNYNNNTYIIATSPAINLTGYNSITLDIKIWYNTESSYDGMKIEYSLNNGSSWSDLGSVNSNWYNDSDVDAFNNNEDGWSGNSSGWINRNINLSTEDIGFESATQARFRVLFATDYSITDIGVAFDEILIRGAVAVPSYCVSTGNTAYRTGTRQVIFNTINNSSPIEYNAYSDYTAISTTVTKGTSYDLTVKVNTDGNYLTRTYVWVDWNQDLDFDDAGESFYLGTAVNGNNVNTSLSPLSITIPGTASLGTTRMRVSTKYNNSPSSCETDFDGEVEDYTINVISEPSTISTGSISPTTYCSGATVNVPFTLTGTFTSGNIFTAELSNGSGSFASPVSIGTLTSTTGGTISATIPLATLTGTNYRIRVISNTPAVTGTNNGSNITINAIPTISGTTSAARCGTGTVTLGASASAGTVNWFTASTGGSSIHTGTSYTTPSISSTTTYWVAATNNGCTTATRTAVTATVNTIPTISGSTSAARCGTGTVTLGATASAGTVNWFTASTGGSSIHTGTSYTTPSISSTTTYWVSATNNGCTTATRTAVAATVNTIPTISGTTSAARCGTGTVTLGATASAGTVNWFTASTGGSSIHTGTSYTTPSISSTTTYWVAATNNGCTTATRTAVTATVNTIPTISGSTSAARCGTGTVTLGATASAGTVNWFTASTGGSSIHTGTSYTTPSISSSTSYWVDATNGSCTTTTRTEVIATVNKNYWTGNADSNWNNPANWCAGVPTNGVEATLNTLIPSGLTNYPVISSTDSPGYVKKIEFENNTTLIITDNYLRITENLKLDGKIDLEGEAQLLQDLGSTLDPTSSGTLERDQQGTADTYTYNYWSSPVGLPNITTNNNSYTLPDIFQGVNFLATGYNGTASPLGIADYWIWKFSNKTSGDYSQWQHVRSTGTLLAGEGFTMKGPGTGSISTPQNYVLLGKPNNGDINLPISTGNEYLVGNPYPSALDADQFILDNGLTIAGPGSTTGTLYFWEHWGGGSHYLADYQGGYATYSLSGGVPAASMGTNDPLVATGGTPTKTPGRYIPIAQGFFVTAENSGTIKFNNGQRIYQKEDGVNSLFIKQSNTKSNKTSISDTRTKLRIGFNSPSSIRRQILATVDQRASQNYDWGFDSKYIDEQVDDMYWMINNDKYVIQGLNEFTLETILPLGIHTKKAGEIKITIDKIENETTTLNIYLHDKDLNVYHNLKQSDYKVSLNVGTYLNRFEITFSNKLEQTALSIDDLNNDSLNVFYSNKKSSLVIQNPNLTILKSAELFNILGQSVYKFDKIGNEDYQEFKTIRLQAGTYTIKLKTSENIISKKVLIK